MQQQKSLMQNFEHSSGQKSLSKSRIRNGTNNEQKTASSPLATRRAGVVHLDAKLKTNSTVSITPLRQRDQFQSECASSKKTRPVKRPAVSDYGQSVSALCVKIVSMALCVPLAELQSPNRCCGDVALARQIAMYLAHTTFSLAMSEIGIHFGRDRSTVSHACVVVEDKRDQLSFDLTLCQLESLLSDARRASDLCREVALLEEGESSSVKTQQPGSELGSSREYRK